MNWSIYCHINKINGKRYIGLSKNPKKRWGFQGNNYKNNHHKLFWKAILKYGWNNFDHLILEENIPTLEIANEREKYWIAYYHTYIGDTNCWGYNATIGGDGTKGHKMSEEEKIWRRQLRLGKPMPVEWKQHMSKTRRGKKQNLTPKKLEALRNSAHAMAEVNKQKVICLETGIIYDSITEAAKQTGLNINSISACVNHRLKSIKGTHWQKINKENKEN